MQKIGLTFGLVAGAMLSAMMILTLPLIDKIGFGKGGSIGYTSTVFAFMIVYFGVRSLDRRKCTFPHHQDPHPTSEVL